MAEATRPRRASSSATTPPSELPATCGRSGPDASRNAATASASCSMPARPGHDRGRAAEARHVHPPHVALGREEVDHRRPRRAVHADAREQHERRPAAVADMVQRRVGGRRAGAAGGRHRAGRSSRSPGCSTCAVASGAWHGERPHERLRVAEVARDAVEVARHHGADARRGREQRRLLGEQVAPQVVRLAQRVAAVDRQDRESGARSRISRSRPRHHTVSPAWKIRCPPSSTR